VLAVALADRERRRGLLLPLLHRERVVHEQDRAGCLDVVGRAEADEAAAVLLLRNPVDPRARRAVERHLLAIAGEEVLAEVLALLLEEIAQPPDHRVVAQHRVLLLRDVLDEPEDDHREDHDREQRPRADRQDLDRFRHGFSSLLLV
jgi:hypothetical protein